MATAELAEPCLHAATALADSARIAMMPPRRVDDLRAAARTPRTLLFSISHGLGDPRWDDSARRERQGSLLLARNDILTPSQVATEPFLPRGVWMMFACFGAATPGVSSYTHWIEKLADPSERALVVEKTTAVLPRDGIPFVSAAAASALANPDGPIAIIGHADLAWAFSFDDGSRTRYDHFWDALRLIAGGSRLGIALDAILEIARQAANTLTEAINAGAAQRPNVDEPRLLMDWMHYQDLRNFILLGDPAATL